MNELVRLAGIVDESVVDGLGIRMVIFSQGCIHRCPGCHNPESHDFNGGKIFDLETVKNHYLCNPLLDGVTLSGGEPFCQSEPISSLAAWVHSQGGNVWCYTGYTYEQLIELSLLDVSVKKLFDEVDVLVDGRYEEDKKDLLLKFRGSSNQRIIDMVKSRAAGRVELLNLNYI